MNVDDAVELFVETATAAGYVDPDGEDNAVLITVITDDDEDVKPTADQLDDMKQEYKELNAAE